MCSGLNKKGRKNLYYNLAFAEAKSFNLGDYHSMLLAYMVRRKLTHHEEKVNQIIPKAQKWMEKNYAKKKNHLNVSTGHSLENLEIELEELDLLPEELHDGRIISNTVMYIAKRVLDELEKEPVKVEKQP